MIATSKAILTVLIGKIKDKFKSFKGYLFVILVISFSFLAGCSWFFMGRCAYEGYKVVTDPRSVGTQVDDALITAKVKIKLAEDPVTKARNIDVDTVNGVVTLTGLVSSDEEIKRAVKLAQVVEGVRKVVNNLRVGERGLIQHLSDREITARVKAKLIADPDLRALSIDVDTLKGVVTLTGIVEREYQKERAVFHAKSVEGIKAVVVNLQVKAK